LSRSIFVTLGRIRDRHRQKHVRYTPLSNPWARIPRNFSGSGLTRRGPARAILALVVSMHIRNAGEIVSRLLPRLWTAGHLGRKRVNSATFNSRRKLCLLPAIWFSSRSESFLAAGHPLYAPATWGAAPLANGASHRGGNASHSTTIATSLAAAPAATITPSPTFLWGRAFLRNGCWHIPATVLPRPKSEAQPQRSRGAPRHPGHLRSAGRHRHLSHRCAHRAHPPWSSCAATVAAVSGFNSSRRSTSPSSPAQPASDNQNAARRRIRRDLLTAISARPTQRSRSGRHAASCAPSTWSEAQVHPGRRPAFGRSEGEEELDVEADCGFLPRSEFRHSASAILHKAQGQNDGVDG